MLQAKVNIWGKVTAYSKHAVTDKQLENLKKSERKQKSYKLHKDAVKDAGVKLSQRTKKVWLLTPTTTIKDVKTANKALNLYIKNLIENYKLVNYVGVVEFQHNGNVHYHIMCEFSISKINIGKLNAAWCKAISSVLDKTYFEPNALRVGGYEKRTGRRYYYITNVTHAVAYLTKYMSKGNGKFATKCYFISSGIRVAPLLISDAYDVIDTVLSMSKKVYELDYATIYLIDTVNAIELYNLLNNEVL
jgi:hypothetical protein